MLLLKKSVVLVYLPGPINSKKNPLSSFENNGILMRKNHLYKNKI